MPPAGRMSNRSSQSDSRTQPAGPARHPHRRAGLWGWPVRGAGAPAVLLSGVTPAGFRSRIGIGRVPLHLDRGLRLPQVGGLPRGGRRRVRVVGVPRITAVGHVLLFWIRRRQTVPGPAGSVAANRALQPVTSDLRQQRAPVSRSAPARDPASPPALPLDSPTGWPGQSCLLGRTGSWTPDEPTRRSGAWPPWHLGPPR
jgi:hypothetical protein